MSLSYTSRAQWGATPWRGKVYSVANSERTEFFVHYHGAPPQVGTGRTVPRNVEKIHLNNGWAGVGYNFMVDQSGVIYEGRGWGLVGAHCPNHNRSGVGVYVAVGGDQEPSEAAKRAVLALYQEACRKAGRTLLKRGHRDGRKTACPGEPLYSWVRAGMPAGNLSGSPETWDPTDRPVLAKGTKGRHVEALQAELNKVGAKLKVDGDFGPATERAVKEFQGKAGLVTDGIVGAKTYAALAEAQAPAPAEKPASGPAVKSPSLDSKKLPKADRHLGLADPMMRGQDVKNVQNALIVAGYEVKADGIYGRKTADAVNAFNKAQGIKVAGTGPDTWAALRRIVHGS